MNKKNLLIKFRILYCILILLIATPTNLYSKDLFNQNYLNDDGTFNAIIEIPTGTKTKIEYDQILKDFKVEIVQNTQRKIDYLAYPANYGFIPNTLVKKKIGGDGDAVDIIVLGNKLKTGETVKVNIVGMLKLFDNNQIDFKVVSINNDENKKIFNLSSFENYYPGALDLIEIWFLNYKKNTNDNLITSNGYVEAQEAIEFIKFTSIK